MLRILKIVVISILLAGCASKNIVNDQGKKSYIFRISPVKIVQTPNSWLYKNKFLETPFISVTENNETIAGVLYIPANTTKVLGEVNMVVGESEIYGHFPIIDCQNSSKEFDADIKIKPQVHTLFGTPCAKIEI